ncbi:MAG: hypothetical protein OEW02_06085, partial [Myxococcales bacterium]|nr:hypothetical protein [Myxococcales bacterium]
GTRTEVLLEGASRQGAGQQAGRDPYHRVVNLSAAAEVMPPPGALVSVCVVEATPHSLIGTLDLAKTADSARQPLKNGAGSADERIRSVVAGG